MLELAKVTVFTFGAVVNMDRTPFRILNASARTSSLWRSLTGDQQEVERTVIRGFHTAMAKVPREGADSHVAAFEIMHGERLVLVDRQGRIRGFYDADDQDRLLRDARSLTAGGRG